MVLTFFFFFLLILVRHLLAALINISLTWSTAESMSPVSNLLFKIAISWDENVLARTILDKSLDALFRL